MNRDFWLLAHSDGVRPMHRLAAFLLCLAVFLSPALGVNSTPCCRLHVVAFLVPLGKADRPEPVKDPISHFDLPDSSFPRLISQLIALGRADVKLPAELEKGPISVLDVHSFEWTQEQIGRQAKFRHKNQVCGWGYEIELVSWSSDDYVVRLTSGPPWKSPALEIAGRLDRTHLLSLRRLGEFLVFGLTSLSAVPSLPATLQPRADNSLWKLTRRVEPDYPSDLRTSRAEGEVVLAIKIQPDGSVDPQDLVFQSCPHVFFGESAYNAVKKWRYQYSGPKLLTPVVGTVTVSFRLRR